MNNCVKCGNPITATKEKGRKKVYCSIACRRSAELEIRRINERLTGLEKIAERLRLGDVMLKMFLSRVNYLVRFGDNYDGRLSLFL